MSALPQGTFTPLHRAHAGRTPRDGEPARSAPKESTRWIEGYERVAEMAAALPATRLVYVADREADLVELMRCA